MMNGVSVYGVSTFVGSALVGSFLSLGFLSQSSSSPVSDLSSSNSPLMDVSPIIKDLSDTESIEFKKITDLSDSKNSKVNYTQKQLACSERFGVDLSECTRKGRLISRQKNSDEIHFVRKRNTTDFMEIFNNNDTRSIDDFFRDNMRIILIAGIPSVGLVGVVTIFCILLIVCVAVYNKRHHVSNLEGDTESNSNTYSDISLFSISSFERKKEGVQSVVSTGESVLSLFEKKIYQRADYGAV